MPHKIKKTTSEFKRNPSRFKGGRKQAVAIGLSQDRKAHGKKKR